MVQLYVFTGAVNQGGGSVLDPGQIGFGAGEEIVDQPREQREGGPGTKAAGFLERQDAFHPAVSLFAAGAQAAFSP